MGKSTIERVSLDITNCVTRVTVYRTARGMLAAPHVRWHEVTGVVWYGEPVVRRHKKPYFKGNDLAIIGIYGITRRHDARQCVHTRQFSSRVEWRYVVLLIVMTICRVL